MDAPGLDTRWEKPTTKQKRPRNRPELEQALTALLENAIGISITEHNRRDNVEKKYDLDCRDILWRIRRELGISIDEAELTSAGPFNYSIDEIFEVTLRSWRKNLTTEQWTVSPKYGMKAVAAPALQAVESLRNEMVGATIETS